MKNRILSVSKPWAFVAAALCVLASTVSAKLAPNQVVYSPTDQAIEGVMPLTSSYVLTVTSPLTYAAGTTTTVALRVQCSSQSVGDAATANSYVTVSPATLTFTGPGQSQDVTVTAKFPTLTLPAGVQNADYVYQIHTDGWSSDMYDGGASINASVSVPPPGAGNAPTVTITSPDDTVPLSFASSALPTTVTFNFQATADASSPVITAVTALAGSGGVIAGVPVAAVGLGSRTVSGSGTFVVTGPGTYNVQVCATNLIGSATDTHSYVVRATAPAPTVSISKPAPGSTFTYRAGDPATVVDFTFAAQSNFGPVRTLVAKVDNATVAFTPTGIGTSTAGGTIQLPYTTAGAHTVSVTATNDYGTATANSNFTINVVAPTPTIAITAPASNQAFTLPAGATAMDVSYAFTTTANNGFVVNSVSASLGGTAITPTTSGLGTATATSTGTLKNLGAGTYTLTAVGVSAGVQVQASVTFTIKGAQVPPSVVINSPAAGSTYTRTTCGSAVTVPLSFTGTSNTSGGVITALTAALDGAPVAVTTTGMGQKVANGSATLSVYSAGTHTISVTAKDAYGTASATRTFTVTVVPGRTAHGEVFFDIDADGKNDCTEFGIFGVTVKLTDSANHTVTTITFCDGDYCFRDLAPGTYKVSVVPPYGMTTTRSDPTITIAGSDVTVPDIGLSLNFRLLQGMKADGYTIGYWKNNLDKALAGKTNGTQVNKYTLDRYTDAIGDFALSTFDDVTMRSAAATMDSRSSKPVDLLLKQLIASEYNYQNGAYLNDNRTLTFLFLWWGEYVASHPSSFSSSYILWVKDWFDAYNNSHGGTVDGPAP